MIKQTYVPSATAQTVLEKRYLNKNGEDIETPEQMLWRVAKAIAGNSPNINEQSKNKKLAEKFYQMMLNMEFLPNSPTLMNAGLSLGMLSACFVLPIEDSIESIFDGIKHAAMIHKAGGGIGYSFSKLRPANDTVKSTSGVSSGPISFMTVYDAATETIKQGGRRRGANMGILHVSHPDIEEFIKCKSDQNILNNFNISVALTDEFMQAVEENSSFALRNPRTGEIVKQVSARELFSAIGENAYNSGEPGVIFIDAINRANPTPWLGDFESTNPCGEQPLLPYESCNLGSINLAKMVADGKLDYEKLTETVNLAVEFLDNVIDANKYPLPEIADMTYQTRKIGLGVMGFADMLIQLKIPYTSRKALNLAETIMQHIQEKASAASKVLAQLRGPYAARPMGNENAFYRNATRTTIAPTGSISIIANCSSGIEPLFALAFKRRILAGEEFEEIHPYIEEAVKPNLSRYKYNNFKEDLVQAGSLTEEIITQYKLTEFMDPEIFVTAHSVIPEWHLKMQAAFQKYTDNAVSKTINLPKESTQKDIERVYKSAWKLGLKGVTIYRDGSREGQVLSTGKSVEVAYIIPRERPETTTGQTTEIKTGCGKMLVTYNRDESGRLFEVVVNIARGGGCPAANNEVIGRLISLSLRSNIDPKEVIKQLSGIRCPNSVWHKGKQVLSCSDAIGQVLSQVVDGVALIVENNPTPCPDCGGELRNQGGCIDCPSCGYSKCK